MLNIRMSKSRSKNRPRRRGQSPFVTRTSQKGTVPGGSWIGSKSLASLVVLCGLMGLCGMSCPSRSSQEFLPPLLPPQATLELIMGEINANTAKVVSIQSMQGTLSIPGAPSLPMNLVLQPPLQLRLRASTVLTGPELDLGSNPELFWLWVRRQQPPAVYYCRHDQFAASAARQIMPVEPDWLFEAMGLVRFSPADQPRGPYPVGKSRLQIQSTHHGALGDLRKITVVDDLRGVVLEQHLYDAHNARVASAFTSNFHRDPVSGAILPRHIEIQYPSTQFDLKIDLADIEVNTLGPANVQLWVKPEYPGYPNVNLADPNLPVAGGPAGALWTRGNGIPMAGGAAPGSIPANAQLMNPSSVPGFNGMPPNGAGPGWPAASIASLPQPPAGPPPGYSQPNYSPPGYSPPPASYPQGYPPQTYPGGQMPGAPPGYSPPQQSPQGGYPLR